MAKRDEETGETIKNRVQVFDSFCQTRGGTNGRNNQKSGLQMKDCCKRQEETGETIERETIENRVRVFECGTP